MIRSARSWIVWLLAACCWLLADRALAQSPVDLGTVTTQLDLASRIEVLEDRAAAFDPGQALVRQDWLPASPGRLNYGVTDAAIWLRLMVENRSDRALTRWLTLGSPRLEDVGYYRFELGDRVPVEMAVGGWAHPMAERQEKGLVSIFPVRLEPGQSAVLLLRVSGRTRLFLVPGLSEPLAYRVHESNLIIRQLAPLSALVGLILYMLVHGLARRMHHLLLFSLWLFSISMYELTFGGYLYRFVLPSGGEFVVRSTVTLANLSILLGVGFTLQFLRLWQRRLWRWIYLAIIAISLWLVAQAACGDLQLANYLTIPLLTGFVMLWQLSIVQAWYRGVDKAGLFLLASLGLWVAILLRIAEQLGWLPMNAIYEDVLPIQPSLVLGFVMVFGVVRSAFIEQRAYRSTQSALLKARQDEHMRLETLVLERTRTLQDAVIAADEANRARGELLARVNQDLHRPAAEIVALAEPLEQVEGEQADHVGAIRRSASDLHALIDDLIEEAGAGSPLGAVRPEAVDIRRLLDGLATEAEGLALANGNRFVWRPGASLPRRVLVDPKRLRQVLINLLDNAAKFTRHGEVGLEVDAVEGTGVATLTCTVSDTGIGMSHDQLAEVFEPYRRAEEARDLPGLGLGLAIARHWIERMGGGISVDSAPGQGTTMRVTLPLRLPDIAGAPDPAQHELPTAGLPQPDSHSLEQARLCLRLGAVSDLLDWAAELSATRPQYRDFAECVADLAARGDLGVLALCLQCGDEDGRQPGNARSGHEVA